MIEKIYKSEAEWKQILDSEQYAVMRNKETERPFSCEFKDNKGSGIYYCSACGLDLFKAEVKFESHTGWPSFYEPIASDHLIFKTDTNLGIKRVEVLCARCDSHLGHVFDDGPQPSGKRYCINGVALKFVAK